MKPAMFFGEKLRESKAHLRFAAAHRSWAVFVECFGKRLGMAEQAERRQRLGSFFEKLPGPVRLREPDDKFFILEELSWKKQLLCVYLVREVARGRSDLVDTFSLNNKSSHKINTHQYNYNEDA